MLYAKIAIILCLHFFVMHFRSFVCFFCFLSERLLVFGDLKPTSCFNEIAVSCKLVNSAAEQTWIALCVIYCLCRYYCSNYTLCLPLWTTDNYSSANIRSSWSQALLFEGAQLKLNNEHYPWPNGRVMNVTL